MAVESRTVYAGICRQNDVLICGTPEEQEYCDDGSWVPPHIVADLGYEHRICASIYPMVIGRCSKGDCSNMASRCDDPASFIPRDPTCTITHDQTKIMNGEQVQWEDEYTEKTPFVSWTTYGRCGSNRCVWSSEDCKEDEIYSINDAMCTANRVYLGACLVEDGFGYCTVSPRTCLDGNKTAEYVSHQDMYDKYSVNCTLAELPTKIISKTTTTIANNNNKSSSKISQDATTTIGIIIGGGIFLIGILLGITAVSYRRGKHFEKATQEVESMTMIIT